MSGRETGAHPSEKQQNQPKNNTSDGEVLSPSPPPRTKIQSSTLLPGRRHWCHFLAQRRDRGGEKTRERRENGAKKDKPSNAIRSAAELTIPRGCHPGNRFSPSPLLLFLLLPLPLPVPLLPMLLAILSSRTLSLATFQAAH